MINVAIYNEHKLILDGFGAMLDNNADIKVSFTCTNKLALPDKLKNILTHVLILNLNELSVRNINLIIQLTISFPKIKLLVVSAIENDETIIKTIKSGAKGFLGKESSRIDMIEAIYTLRNGFDYYSKSITNLLLNRYINNMKTDTPEQNIDMSGLSNRQTEILKMWGDGATNQEIADKLFISVRTVESHKNHIMQKLNLKNTVDLVKYAIKNNIIEI